MRYRTDKNVHTVQYNLFIIVQNIFVSFSWAVTICVHIVWNEEIVIRVVAKSIPHNVKSLYGTWKQRAKDHQGLNGVLLCTCVGTIWELYLRQPFYFGMFEILKKQHLFSSSSECLLTTKINLIKIIHSEAVKWGIINYYTPVLHLYIASSIQSQIIKWYSILMINVISLTS